MVDNGNIDKIYELSSKQLKEIIRDNMRCLSHKSIRGVDNYINIVGWQISEERWEYIPQVLLQVFTKEELRKVSKKGLMQIYVTLFKLHEEITSCK